MTHRKRARRRRSTIASLLLVALSLLAQLGPSIPRASADQPAAIGLASQTVLADRIRARIKDAGLGEKIGVSIVNLRSGRAIVSHNSTLPLNPASNTKLVTAAVALLELGADFRMRTGLYGRQEGDAVVGGLYLKGFGDTSLDTGALADLAAQLVSRGIKRVDELLVDGSYFDDQILPPAFEQQPDEVSPFRAAVAAISVEANAYTLRLRPGSEEGAGAFAQVDGEGHFEITNELTTTASGPPSVVADQDQEADKLQLRLSGGVPMGITGVTYRRRVESPLYFAGYKMVEALRAARIQVPASAKLATTPRGAALLASRTSAPLSQLLLALGKRSDNFTAEMLLKVIAAEATGKPGSSAEGARIALATLRKLGISTDDISLVNGSGLFEGNKIAAADLTKLLAAVYKDTAIRPEFLSQLAVGGSDGTLARRLDQLPAPRIVRAKTGTLADVITLSGYVLGDSPDRAIAFSFLANGVRGKHHAARSLADAIASDVAMHLYQSTPAATKKE